LFDVSNAFHAFDLFGLFIPFEVFLLQCQLKNMHVLQKKFNVIELKKTILICF